MNISRKYLYVLFISANILYTRVSAEFQFEDYCNAEDSAEAEALSHWYSQVYKFVHTNQNVTQHMIKIEQELRQQQISHNLQINNLQEQLRNMKAQMTDQHLNSVTITEELKQQQISQNLQINSLQEQLTNLKAQMTDIQGQLLKSTSQLSNEIVIQRRQDGSVDFYRPWVEYKQGFGNPAGEFFIGLEKLHKLTNSRPHSLLIVMEDWQEQRRFAKYDLFVIGSELEKYTLKELGAYSGTAGDSLSYHKGQKFSTKDQENDSQTYDHCAEKYKGAWWYNACLNSNLNGLYLKWHVGVGQWAQGIHWGTIKGGNNTLKFVEMILIRI